jgi:hypothetical protein
MARALHAITKHLAGFALGGALLAAPLAAHAPPPGEPATGWAPAPTSVVDPARNTDQDAWEAYKKYDFKPSVDQHLSDPILRGAIDLHAHFGPDSYARQWDAFEIAKMAHERGMRGLVFKNHWSESAGLAYLIRKYDDVPGLEVFGGLALNATVGGINPQAVRYFAEVDGHYARIVWMPTHDSEQEVRTLKDSRPFVMVSKDGVLLPQVLEVLDLIKRYDLTLATGHVSAEEMLQITREANKRGIKRIIITHPDLGPQFTNATIGQLKEAVALGGYVEVVATELLGKTRDHFIDLIRTIGPAHCIVSSDSGLVGSHNHADALVMAIRVLREGGFGDADLDLMFRKNPAFLVKLPALAD